MRVSSLVFLFTILIHSALFAQKETNIWYFSDRAGLDFNSGKPVPLFNGMIGNPGDGNSTVSDANGNLLFYSNGVTVWNRNHVPMPNGNGLMGHVSASQSVVAVPKPNSRNIYYLFTVDAIENNLSGGLRYSIVDMSLANGFGDVTVKNVLLETPVTENLTATMHANNTDYWIISHRWNSNAYTAYLLTANGVMPVPVVSTAGISVQGTYLNATGVLKASPDGTRLGHAIRELEGFQLLDFNKSAGIISNAIISPRNYPVSVGVEFSPDGTKMYCSAAGTKSIYQFDLKAPDIFASGVLIGTPAYATTHMQIGSDGKIYCSQRDSYYLGVINDPNKKGTSCNYTYNGLYLGGRSNWFALPNFPTNYFNRNSSPNPNPTPNPLNHFLSLNECYEKKVSFSIPGINDQMTVSWNFGDPSTGILNTSTEANPVHIFSNKGIYEVTLTITTPDDSKVITQEVKVLNDICDLFIPNIITPNQDNLNEKFSIRGLKTEEFKLQIYNRWGVQVYETKSYKNDWNAENVSAAVYYYMLRNNKSGKTYRGWLEVIK